MENGRFPPIRTTIETSMRLSPSAQEAISKGHERFDLLMEVLGARKLETLRMSPFANFFVRSILLQQFSQENCDPDSNDKIIIDNFFISQRKKVIMQCIELKPAAFKLSQDRISGIINSLLNQEVSIEKEQISGSEAGKNIASYQARVELSQLIAEYSEWERNNLPEKVINLTDVYIPDIFIPIYKIPSAHSKKNSSLKTKATLAATAVAIALAGLLTPDNKANASQTRIPTPTNTAPSIQVKNNPSTK